MLRIRRSAGHPRMVPRGTGALKRGKPIIGDRLRNERSPARSSGGVPFSGSACAGAHFHRRRGIGFEVARQQTPARHALSSLRRGTARPGPTPHFLEHPRQDRTRGSSRSKRGPCASRCLQPVRQRHIFIRGPLWDRKKRSRLGRFLWPGAGETRRAAAQRVGALRALEEWPGEEARRNSGS